MYGQQFKLLDGINVSELVEGLCEVYENSIVERIKHILDFHLERYKESRDRGDTVNMLEELRQLNYEE